MLISLIEYNVTLIQINFDSKMKPGQMIKPPLYHHQSSNSQTISDENSHC